MPQKSNFLKKIKDLLLSERGGSSKGPFANFGISEERDYFLENLAMLISSGMTILTALDAIRSEMRSTRMRHALTEMRDDVDAGFAIWRALDRTKLVKPHIVSLIRIGEEAGQLTENLHVVVSQQRKDRTFKSKLRSAMMYPVLVLVMIVVIGTGIAWFILPNLMQVFSSMNLELPLPTRILMWVGNALESYGLIIVPVMIAIMITIGYYVFIYPKTKFIGEAILSKLPGIGLLLVQVEISRFCYILGTLLNSGMPVVEALNSLQESTTSTRYGKFYGYLRESIEEGRTFQQSFATYPKVKKLVPRPVQQMIVAAENSGTLSDTLQSISEIYEEKTETTTKNLSVIMEPVLLFIVWGGVVGVALAVILPIYSLIGGLNSSNGGNKSAPPAKSTTVPAAETTTPLSPPEGTTTQPSQPAAPVEFVEILSTPDEYLNVRSAPGPDGDVITRVYEGELYQYVAEQNGWYNIVLLDGGTGWVFGNYARKTQ